MKLNFGKNRKCRNCGGEPSLHFALFGLVGLVCRRCTPTRHKVFPSIAKARKYWNRVNTAGK